MLLVDYLLSIHTKLTFTMACLISSFVSVLPYLLLISSSFLFYIVVQLQHKLSSTRNRSISYPLVGCLIAFYQNRYRLLDWYTELLAESPTQSIVIKRFGSTRTIVTANPKNVEYMLKTNFGNFPKGKPFTELLGDLLGSGIFNADGELWQIQRKLASHGFTTRSLRTFVENDLKDEVQTRLLPTLQKAVERNEVVDLQELLRTFAFNIVCKFSLGIDPLSIDLASLAEDFDAAAMICARRGAAPIFLVWKIKRLLCIGTEGELKKHVDHIREQVMKITKKKKEAMLENKEENGTTDLLSYLISSGEDDSFIIDMVISFIMAGKDTTSSAMTWFFWLLSRHPLVENNLIKEVRNTIHGNGILFIDYEGLKEMEMLKACLCESMRLYPPVAWDSKHALVADVLPDGTRVNAGDRVTYFPYGMGRMEKLWGKDRLEFRPDRWFSFTVQGEEGEVKNMSPYKFAVFQAGPRVCLGKEMAFMQMKYVVASILDRFELKPISPVQPVFLPLLTSHMAGGLKVTVQSRNRTGVAAGHC